MEPSSQEHQLGSNNGEQTSPKQEAAAAPSLTISSIKAHHDYVQRSYTCTFCEKGFSNAQALGGHMNIHRRDRARLRNRPDASPLIIRSLSFTQSDRTDHDDPLDLELRLGSPSSSSSSPSARKTT